MNQVQVPERGELQGFFDSFAEFAKNHLRNRPLHRHMAAWVLVGVVLGLLMTPSYQLSAVAGFTLSGVFCCGLLGLVTYPVSEHFLWTLAGSTTGLLACQLALETLESSVWNQILLELGLVSGALLGATSLLWLLPIRFIFRTFAANSTKTPPSGRGQI